MFARIPPSRHYLKALSRDVAERDANDPPRAAFTAMIERGPSAKQSRATIS